MTVYARSDVMSVALSTSHGGCGATHTRPVTQGVPDAVWQLNCVACENHLRHDPLWATMPADVPETPDEERIREDRDKKGALDRDRLLTDAILTIAQSQGNLPEQLARALLALNGQVPETVDRPCRAGHPNKPDSRFCSTCGVTLEDAEPVSIVESAADPTEPGVPTDPDPTIVSDLTAMSLRDLRTLAQDRGLDIVGTKAQLIERLSGTA
jgi:hypothetical protein